MNLEYLTDAQVKEFFETAHEAQSQLVNYTAPGWSDSLTEHLRFKLRSLGVHDIPDKVSQIYQALRIEKKERELT